MTEQELNLLQFTSGRPTQPGEDEWFQLHHRAQGHKTGAAWEGGELAFRPPYGPDKSIITMERRSEYNFWPKIPIVEILGLSQSIERWP